jgi:hypothetical protein
MRYRDRAIWYSIDDTEDQFAFASAADSQSIAAEDLATHESAVPYGALSAGSTAISGAAGAQDVDADPPSDAKKSLETRSIPVPVLSELQDDEFAEPASGDSLPILPAPTPVGNFHINLIFNASVNNAPPGFVQAVQNAAAQIESQFSDSITVNITVGWGEIGGQAITRSHIALGGAATGHFYTYAQTVTALTNDRTTADDFTAVGAMPGFLNPNGNGSVVIDRAQERALGLVAATDAVVDGNIGFSTDFSSSFWVGGAIHEITHAMGRMSGYADYGIRHDALHRRGPARLRRRRLAGLLFDQQRRDHAGELQHRLRFRRLRGGFFLADGFAQRFHQRQHDHAARLADHGRHWI